MRQEEKPEPPSTKLKPVSKQPIPAPSSAVLRERAWADRVNEDKPEPYEETYRDGSIKNECW